MDVIVDGVVDDCVCSVVGVDICVSVDVDRYILLLMFALALWLISMLILVSLRCRH